MTVPPACPEAATVTITLDGGQHVIICDVDETIVQAAWRTGIHPPISCLSGSCGTCVARLTSGSVEMVNNEVLSANEIAQGYVLTCQSLPTSSAVAVVYE